MVSLYYQAQVKRSEVWYVTAILRSFEHVALDRTIDVKNSIFEFFVPESQQVQFELLIDYFVQHNLVSHVELLPNRLIDSGM